MRVLDLWFSVNTDEYWPVEASLWDVLWGIGLYANDPRALHRKTWKGKNWLGFILTELREEFFAAEMCDEPNYRL